MPLSRAEREVVEVFGQKYRLAPSAAARDLERTVLGGDWGGDGYTTMAQARRLAEVLGLGPESRLLDLGSGRGWPALYLVRETRCRAVLADLPAEGLGLAAARAGREGIAGRCRFVVSTGHRLPFRDRTFDAVTHTDVLC